MVVSVSKKFLSEGRDESKQGEPIQRRDEDLNGSDTNCHIPRVDMSKSIPNNTNEVFPVYESDSPNQGSPRGYNPENGIKDWEEQRL